MVHQGVHLLQKFAQDDRVQIPQPNKDLQVKLMRSLPGDNEFVAYIDALGKLDGVPCVIDWKTTTSRYPEEPAGLLALDPQLICYSWISGIPGRSGGGFRAQATTGNSIPARHDFRRTTAGVRPAS